ncbi:hypothetical protein DFP74_6609 [Nocardiopsis sp. Huas11]|uniref:hypothetical protein n=1 Tax=Nocardiopsis sp. Huas11 TaxID=2183912 RepID=UPI000F0D653B|nr:hypothetical protein [Nocardiopsis sp. Huas11]RKS10826.1 hypothetical protein DFP74_6609 [Nocardiopsis sp. Huas11]
MSYPDPPQQPQWQPQQPGQPGQGYPAPYGGAPGQQQPAYPQHGAPAGGMPGGGMPGGPPGGPPYGGQYAGGQMPPSGGGRRNRWLIPTAAGVAVVVMAGTVWATVSLVDFGGPQPETVLPGNSIAFGKLDLSIDGSQAIDLLRFVDQLPQEMLDEMGEPDGDTSTMMAEGFVEAFPEANQSDVEEWIGQGVGGSVWPTTDEEASEGQGVSGAIALSVTDEALAEEELGALASQRDDLAFEVVDDFALLSFNEAAIADLNRQIEAHGPLDGNDTFSGDLSDVPGGSVSVGWLDLGGLMEIEEFAQEVASELPSETGAVSGRATASVRIDGDFLEARMDVFGFEADQEDLSWLAQEPGASVTAMGGLSDDTVVALGGAGLDQAATSAYEDGVPFLSSGEQTEMERSFNSMGLPIPESFGGLLGTSTAYGFTDVDLGSMFGGPTYYRGFADSSAADGDVTYEYRAVGGDEQVLSDFVAEIAGPYSDPLPDVRTDGDAVVVANGTTGTGRLADDEVFQQTMQELDDAVLAGYVDLRQVMPAGEVAAPEEWGAVGVALSVTDDGERASFELRWAPSGGE